MYLCMHTEQVRRACQGDGYMQVFHRCGGHMTHQICPGQAAAARALLWLQPRTQSQGLHACSAAPSSASSAASAGLSPHTVGTILVKDRNVISQLMCTSKSSQQTKD